ncbi:DNA alkylation repair protein [Halobacillus sp. Marseille-Q1614]
MYGFTARVFSSSIENAVGWALREYSKTIPSTVDTYIENNELRPL